MSQEANVAKEGFQLLEQFSLEELDRRIDYLENALQVYKLFRTVRELAIRQPTDFATPPAWQSAVDMDREDKVQQALPTTRPRKPVQMVSPEESKILYERIEQYVYAHPGLRTGELGRQMALPINVIQFRLEKLVQQRRLEVHDRQYFAPGHYGVLDASTPAASVNVA